MWIYHEKHGHRNIQHNAYTRGKGKSETVRKLWENYQQPRGGVWYLWYYTPPQGGNIHKNKWMMHCFLPELFRPRVVGKAPPKKFCHLPGQKFFCPAKIYKCQFLSRNRKSGFFAGFLRRRAGIYSFWCRAKRGEKPGPCNKILSHFQFLNGKCKKFFPRFRKNFFFALGQNFENKVLPSPKKFCPGQKK